MSWEVSELLLEARALDSKSSAHLIPPPASLPFLSPLLPWPLSVPTSTLSVFPLLSLSFRAEFLQIPLEERQRIPLAEKGKGRSRAESWRVEVRQLHCHSRRPHLHCSLCKWSPLELGGAQPGQPDAATLVKVGHGLWSEVNARGDGKPRIEQNGWVVVWPGSAP